MVVSDNFFELHSSLQGMSLPRWPSTNFCGEKPFARTAAFLSKNVTLQPLATTPKVLTGMPARSDERQRRASGRTAELRDDTAKRALVHESVAYLVARHMSVVLIPASSFWSRQWAAGPDVTRKGVTLGALQTLARSILVRGLPSAHQFQAVLSLARDLQQAMNQTFIA